MRLFSYKKKRLILLALLTLLTISCNEIENPILSERDNELITLTSGIQVVKSGDNYILGGDILLSSEQVDMLRQPQTRGSIKNDLGKRWMNQIVYYTFSENLSASYVRGITDAINYIENRTNVQFALRTTQVL